MLQELNLPSADEATAASESAGTAASEAAQPATTESSQAEAPAASKAYGEGGSVPKIDLSGTAAATQKHQLQPLKKLRQLQHQPLQKNR